MKFNIPKEWLASKAHLEEGQSIEAGRLNTEAMNINDRPAPETDRVERIIPSRLSPAEFDQQQGEWVPADFARRLERQRDAATAALQKINVIRNSIIAHQSCNFSEHVYPLVAALNEAGIEGMTYPDALAYYGPMTERAVKAEKQRDAAVEALEDIMHSLDVGIDPRDCRDGEATSPKSRARATLAAIKGGKL